MHFVADPGLHRTMLGDGLACLCSAFLAGTTKELSTMPKTFVYTAITVKKQMPVEKSCSAVLNVHPVQPATKPVRISKRNGAADLIRRLMYVMAVQ